MPISGIRTGSDSIFESRQALEQLKCHGCSKKYNLSRELSAKKFMALFEMMLCDAVMRPLLPSHTMVTQHTSVLEQVGADNLLRLFGPGADTKLTARLTAHAKKAGIFTSTPVAEVASFIESSFARITLGAKGKGTP